MENVQEEEEEKGGENKGGKMMEKIKYLKQMRKTAEIKGETRRRTKTRITGGREVGSKIKAIRQNGVRNTNET